jgi:hypothetical protein
LPSSFVSTVEPTITKIRQYNASRLAVAANDAPMVIPKMLPKLRRNMRKESACPAREGGSGASTGNTVAA